jgi:hypothetical protein
MASQDEPEHERARSTLAELIESPASSRSKVPTVVGLLDHEDDYLRLSAACGICLVAVAKPDLVDYLVRRLIDRLHDDDARAESVLAFEYLATQFPERVDGTLQEIREESEREPLAYTRSGLRRSNIYNPSPGDKDVGRTRMAGEGRDPGPQQVYTDDVDVEAERRLREDEEDVERADAEGAETGEETDDDGEKPEEESDTVRPAIDVDAVPTGVIDRMLSGPTFDDVTIKAIGVPNRYADRYRLLGMVRGMEAAVDLRVFHRPEQRREEFARRLDDALTDWSAVDHDHVVGLYAFDHQPYPWVAAEMAESDLTERGVLRPREALLNATQIASGLSALHDRGIVHGGLEPRAIAYTITDDERSEYQRPLVDDVGLLEAYRFSHRPEAYLDPRYAAPEYFDPTFGTVDHATDIYQFGAICYRLFTGRPPFDVDPTQARQYVCRSMPQMPSQVLETVPALVDRIVEKAMAKRKLTRYESVAQMEQDLLRVRNHLEHDD